MAFKCELHLTYLFSVKRPRNNNPRCGSEKIKAVQPSLEGEFRHQYDGDNFVFIKSFQSLFYTPSR